MKIAIIGAGKMGSWLARELSKENEVMVFARNKKNVLQVGKAKVVFDLAALEKFKPDYLVNAASLQNTVEAFKAAEKFVSKSTALVDITSIKANIPEYYASCGFAFVSLHPMFGPTFANTDSLGNESVVLIKESDKSASKFFADFFEKLKVKVFNYSFKEHDEMMAYSLTLPFVSTMVFSACMSSLAVPGTTFKKHKEIAKGLLSEDDHLLAEILFNQYSAKQLENVTGKLEFLKHVIAGRDFDEAKKFFDKLRNNVG